MKKGGENMKKLSKHLIAFAIFSFLAIPFFTLPALAQNNVNNDFGLTAVNNGVDGLLPTGDPREMIGRIIRVALSFLGLIAVVIILMGGFKWMTAGGNEEKVSEAKKLLGAGVIGLAIVLASWAISTFVIGAIYNAASNTGV